MNYLINLAIVPIVGVICKTIKTLAFLALIVVSGSVSSASAEVKFREFPARVYTYGCSHLLETGKGDCLVTLRSKISGVLNLKLSPTRAGGLSPKRHFRAFPYKNGRMNLVSASTVSENLEFTFLNLRRKNRLFTLILPRAPLEEHDGAFNAVIERSVGYRKLGCGTDTVNQVLSDPDLFPIETHAVTNAATASSLDVWAVADTQFVSDAGGSSAAVDEMESAANFTSTVYEADLGITLTLETSTLSSTNGLTSTDSKTLLNQFVNYGESQSSPSRDAALLFSGKNFDGIIIGLAFSNAVCRIPSSSYGVIERSTAMITEVIMAHELGHIIGHGSPNAHDPNNQGIMTTELNENSLPNAFSAFSINKILTYLGTYGSCVSGDASFSATLTAKVSDTGKKQRVKVTVKPTGSGFSGYRVEIWGGTNCDQVSDLTSLTSTGTLVGTISGDLLFDGVNVTRQAKVNYSKKAKNLCFQAVIADDTGDNKSFTGVHSKTKLITGDHPKSPAQILTQLADKIVGP